MKTSICIIGLARKYTKFIAKKLSDKLDMFFADVNDLVEFDLLDINSAKNICGISYVNKIEENKIKMLTTFENTLITFDYAILNNPNNYERVKNHYIVIYLSFTKENFIKKIKSQKLRKSEISLLVDAFNDRNILCNKYCDVNVDCNDKTVSQILVLIQEKLLEYAMKG